MEDKRVPKNWFQFDPRPSAKWRVLTLANQRAVHLVLLAGELFQCWEHWVPSVRRTRPCVPGCEYCSKLPIRQSFYSPASLPLKVSGKMEWTPTVARFSETQQQSLVGFELFGLPMIVFRGTGLDTFVEVREENRTADFPRAFDWKRAVMNFWGCREWPAFEAPAEAVAEADGSILPMLPRRKQA